MLRRSPTARRPAKPAFRPPWTANARCLDNTGSILFTLDVNGPGEAQIGLATSLDDQTYSDSSYGEDLTTTGTVVNIDQGGSHFKRRWGTVMLRSSTTVAELDVHAVVDARDGLNHCFLYGTATLGA